MSAARAGGQVARARPSAATPAGSRASSTPGLLERLADRGDQEAEPAAGRCRARAGRGGRPIRGSAPRSAGAGRRRRPRRPGTRTRRRSTPSRGCAAA